MRPAGRLKPWQSYVFAILATGITLGLRLTLAGQLRGRPTLIVFTVPIMLAAYLGGLRAGLLATVLSYLGASYYLLPPIHSFRVAYAVDRWDLFFMVLAGAASACLTRPPSRALPSRHRHPRPASESCSGQGGGSADARFSIAQISRVSPLTRRA
jgi:K+-sensing histidine kinase KdpD